MRGLTALPLAVAACLAAAPALAAGTQSNIQTATDRDWVSVTGDVKATVDGHFLLDYGAGEITVEMDGFNWHSANILQPGDDVTVTGRIDNDFFERRSIEAASVFVDKRDTYYYANPADEEGGTYAAVVASYATDREWIGITGTVVSRLGDRITVRSGTQQLAVDLGGIDDAPSVNPGDRISVYGPVAEADIFEGHELQAYSVTILSQG